MQAFLPAFFLPISVILLCALYVHYVVRSAKVRKCDWMTND
jgi:hypothetical protein